MFLTTFRQDPAGGPAKARNRGWRAAAAPLVAFTDDDCRPSTTWLQELLEDGPVLLLFYLFDWSPT